jgi:hypothetical protein
MGFLVVVQWDLPSGILLHGELEHGPFVDDLLIESGDVPVRKKWLNYLVGWDLSFDLGSMIPS